MSHSVVAKNVFLWCLSAIYLFAFVSLYYQIPGLYGKDGILPARLHLKDDCVDNHEKCGEWASLGECHNNPNWMLKNCEISCNVCQGERSLSESFWRKPTLLWFAPSLQLSVDSMMDLLCLIGAVISFAMLLLPRTRNGALLAILWFLYFSLYQAGQTFLWFQWDILLLETGFLGIFVAPWSLRSQYDQRPRDAVCFWLIKWLIFRLMFQSGVVKLTSQCPTWWGLTALNYHYESQCIPTQLAWYAHQLPEWFQKFSVAITFIIEIGVPFLFFFPWRPARIFSFYAQLLLQLLIILTGNYNFFNLLTITLCLSLVDNQFFIGTFPSFIKKVLIPENYLENVQMKKSTFAKIATPISYLVFGICIFDLTKRQFDFELNSKNTLVTKIAFSKADFNHFLAMAVPISIGIAVVSFVTEVAISFYKCLQARGKTAKFISCAQTVFFTAAATWLFSVSLVSMYQFLGLFRSFASAVLMPYLNGEMFALITVVPYTDLDRGTQSNIWPVIHKWYRKADSYQIANSYGLFRSMTGVGGRPELIVEGSNNIDGPWKEYNFKYKPGKLDEGPTFIIPHQPRLDWQMWFAALGNYQYNAWFVNLVDKLLNNKTDVLALLGENPFPEHPPKFIKSTLYSYHYTKLPRNTTSISDGLAKSSKIRKWWKRNKPAEYTPPLTKDNQDVKNFLFHHGLIADGPWPENPSGSFYNILLYLRSWIHQWDPTWTMLNMVLLALIFSTSSAVNSSGKQPAS